MEGRNQNTKLKNHFYIKEQNLNLLFIILPVSFINNQFNLIQNLYNKMNMNQNSNENKFKFSLLFCNND